MYLVVFKKYSSRTFSISLVSDKFARIRETNLTTVIQHHLQLAINNTVLSGIFVGVTGKRCCVIKEFSGIRDDQGTASRVVLRRLFGTIGFRKDIRTIQCII